MTCAGRASLNSDFLILTSYQLPTREESGRKIVRPRRNPARNLGEREKTAGFNFRWRQREWPVGVRFVDLHKFPAGVSRRRDPTERSNLRVDAEFFLRFTMRGDVICLSRFNVTGRA